MRSSSSSQNVWTERHTDKVTNVLFSVYCFISRIFDLPLDTPVLTPLQEEGLMSTDH